MPKTNVPDARGRILQAALQAFAEKGFEGSRIDEIARLAQVPKSLIYYHFKSKDEMLQVLFTDFIREYKELLAVAKHDGHQAKAETMGQRLSHHYYGFAMRNADLIRIIFIESLRKDTVHPVIFQVAEAIVEAEAGSPVAQAVDYDRNERLIAEFFGGVVPLFAYLCFADGWVRQFGVERTTFDKQFLSVMASTHGAYHASQGERSVNSSGNDEEE